MIYISTQSKQQINQLQQILFQVWSLQSSSKWTSENPAQGQCGVTALVVQDVLGGEIYKTNTPGVWHFYNFIQGQRHDFTASQFEELIKYMDIPSNREEAFTDTNEEQYRYLSQSVAKYILIEKKRSDQG